MKPLHIVLLVLAGAVVGAVVMTVAQRAHRVETPAVARVAKQPAPNAASRAESPAPAAPVPATPAAQPAAEERPAPPVEFTETVKAAPAKARRAAPPPANPRPIVIARNTPSIAQNAPAAEPAANPPATAPQPAAAGPQPVQEPPAPAAATSPVARPEPEPAAPAPPPPSNKVTLNAGTLVPVRLIDGLSSERNNPGDAFTATLDKELVVDGFVIAERGARAEGRVVASDRGGKVRGVAALAIELTRIHTSDGQAIAVQTDSFEKHAEPSQKEDAAKVGIGAVVGAAIGAIAGGGKGAAIGAGAGGAAGAGGVLLTRGKPAAMPSETRLSFRLRAPVTIVERR